MKWQDTLAAAIRAAARVLLIAVIGAMADAGLMGGDVGRLLVAGLPGL